mgnify:FL=1
MLEDHAKLIAFFKQANEIVGRKKLQKMIYILKKSGYHFSERYSFHMYGPYSEELSTRVEELCNLGFLNENREKEKGYVQYRYTLTDSGESFLKETDIHTQDMTHVIFKMNEKSSRFLELVSTMLYFNNLPKDEVEAKVKTVKSKQNYTDDEMKEAWNFIEKINVH